MAKFSARQFITGAIESLSYRFHGSNFELLAILEARKACWALQERESIASLADAEFRVSSQWGEDGIIEWLVQNLPAIPKSFVEFGVETYREANTRFLLRNRNWRGLVLDSDSRNISNIKNDQLYWQHDLSAACVFITRENINESISSFEPDGELGILSIDIDGNDYWIWEAIVEVDPIIVICEYNAVFGDVYPITIPYNQEFNRTEAHYSNLYFGASIGALQHLAERKGYVFAGTNLAGNNAFFIRRTHAQRILDRVGDTAARPSLFRESRDPTGNLTYISGKDRFNSIKDQQVVRVDTGEVVTLASLGSPYSETWEAQLG